jgi:hypothetical protein
MINKTGLDLLTQNAPGMDAYMATVGCFVRSAIAIAEIAAGRCLTASQINGIHEEAERRGYIYSKEIKQSAPIANIALGVLGKAGRYVEVGTTKGGVPQYYPSAINGGIDRTDAAIRKIRQPAGSKYENHFKVVKGNEVIFDPWDPNGIDGSTVYDICYALVGTSA